MAVDMLHMGTTPPRERDFVWPGFRAGTVGALIAPGATGKSFWALEAAMSVACPIPGGDLLGLEPKNSGRVVYIAAEDGIDTIHERVYDTARHLQPEVFEAICEQMSIEPVLGKQLDIMALEWTEQVLEWARDTRLVVIDTLSRIHQLEENSNGDMSRLLSTLEFISAETGTAILFVHHASKAASFGSDTDHQHASRGASVLTDNARYAGAIVKMSEKEAGEDQYDVAESRRDYFVRYSVTKNNYGSPLTDRWYQRHEGGVLKPAHLEKKNRPAGNGNGKRNGGRNEYSD